MGRLEELREAILRHCPEGVRRDVIPGLGLATTHGRTAPTATMTEPSVTLIASGRKRVSIGQVDVEYGPGEYLVATLDLPITGHVSRASLEEPFAVASLVLRPAVIAGLVLDTADIAERRGFIGLAVSHADSDLLDSVTRLVRLIDRPDDQAALGASIEREVAWRLLTGPQGGVVRQIGLVDSGLAHIARATRWMRDHLAEPLTIAELARISGMSPSSFHRHFRTATSMSPIQWQKALRLREARTALLTRDVGVADAAFAVGYGSASQFSRDYRRAFGISPRDDVRRLRHDASVDLTTRAHPTPFDAIVTPASREPTSGQQEG